MPTPSLPLLPALRADARRDGASGVLVAVVRALFTIRFQSVVLVRVAAALHRRSPAVASVVKYLNSVLTGCDVSAAARIGPGFRMHHPAGVVIGPEVVIGADCTIQQHVTLGMGGSGSPTLDDGVQIGPGAVVLGGVRIGQGARVGANSVITAHDVGPYELWAGVPARLIRTVAPSGSDAAEGA